MGNATIQPTMYFSLRNVPMFSGPYMITDVNHSIKPGAFDTVITGIRQPVYSVQKIDSYIQSIKQNLENFNILYSHATQTFIYASEFYNIDEEILKGFDRPNVIIFCPKLHWKFVYATAVETHFWLGNTISLYRDLTNSWLNEYKNYSDDIAYQGNYINFIQQLEDFGYETVWPPDHASYHQTIKELNKSFITDYF